MTEETTLYVRVKPYNLRQGALANRVTVGGKLFEAGNWYRVKESAAGMLADLVQATGVPFFDVLTEAEHIAAFQRDMRAAMTAAGFQGLSLPESVQGAPVKTHRTGPVKGAYDGLATQVVDVNPSNAAQLVAAAEVPNAPQKSTNVDTMSMQELKDLAGDLGISVRFGASKEALKKQIKTASAR